MPSTLNNNKFNELANKFNQIKQNISAMEEPGYFKEKAYLKYYQLLVQNLDNIFSNSFAEETTIQSLQDFFRDNLKYTKVNFLTPSVIPEVEIILFLCSIVPEICGDKKPIQILFGDDIQWETQNDNYPDLDEKIPLERIIATHIISDDGSNLIPILCLREDLILEDYYQPQNAIYKHYGNYDKNFKPLSRNEMTRLIEHSKVTEELNAAVELHHKLSNEKADDLYSNLDRLCRLLRIQDAYGGRGEQNHTGEGTFIALTQFIEYYDKLSDEKKIEIPAPVKMALDHLLNVSSEYKGLMASRVETCSADRRTELVIAMKGFEKDLSLITISNDKADEQKKEALETKEKHMKDLIRSLETGSYKNGSDKLGLNRKLLEDLQLPYHIKSPRDLEFFKKLHAADIKELLTDNEKLRNELIETISTLENFIFLTHELSRDSLSVILDLMSDLLIAHYVSNEADFYALLMTHEDYETFINLYKTFNKSYYNIKYDLLSPQQIQYISDIQIKNLLYLKEIPANDLQLMLSSSDELKNNIFEELNGSPERFRIFTTKFNTEQLKVLFDNLGRHFAVIFVCNYFEYYSLLKEHKVEESFNLIIENFGLKFAYQQGAIDQEQNGWLLNYLFNKISFLSDNSTEEIRANFANDNQLIVKVCNILQIMPDFIYYIHDLEMDKLKVLMELEDKNFISIYDAAPIYVIDLLKTHSTADELEIIIKWFGAEKCFEIIFSNESQTDDEYQIESEEIQTIIKILAKYMNFNWINSQRSSAITYALHSKNCSLNAIKLFLELGVDINHKDQYGISALWLSLSMHSNSSKKQRNFLLDNGANIFEKSPSSRPLYAEGIRIDRTEFSDRLLMHKCNLNEVCKHIALIDILQSGDYLFSNHIIAEDFLHEIKFPELECNLLLAKIALDKNTSIFSDNNRRAEALAELIKDLVLLRREFIAITNKTNSDRHAFTIKCLNALEKARPELEKFELTASIIFKFVACLLIVPIFILYLCGALNFQPKIARTISSYESALLSNRFFREPPPSIVPEIIELQFAPNPE